MTDTIFALATAPGRAALAVVRVSGPAAAAALETLAGRLPLPRRASVRRLIDPVSRETLDQSLTIFMPGPGSFTGEDVVELHLHGGPAVVAAVAGALASLGLRAADPGEFTRRAFEHGRLDLIGAEAVADLVDAESASQRRQALGQLEGASTSVVESWRNRLIEAMGALEAAIDFPDEDLPLTVGESAAAPLVELCAEISAAAGDLRGEQVRQGYRVGLIGAPNAGKSSLLNRLVGRDAAIVTEIPGTTRDVLEHPLELAGYRLLLADTAGLRRTDDRIEVEGVRRARSWAEAADLRLWVVDASAHAGTWEESLPAVRAGDFMVLNKTDLLRGADAQAVLDVAHSLKLEPIRSSAVVERGAHELRDALERRVIRDLGGGPPAATRQRHRRLFISAAGHLSRALGAWSSNPELAADDVRLAARALESLTGRVGADSVLEEVFSKFCIGK